MYLICSLFVPYSQLICTLFLACLYLIRSLCVPYFYLICTLCVAYCKMLAHNRSPCDLGFALNRFALYQITPSYSAVIPNTPINMIKHIVLFTFRHKTCANCKKVGEIAFPSTDIKFATVYHCSCKKSATNARDENSRG